MSTENNKININFKHNKKEEEDVLRNRTSKKLTAPKEKKLLRQKIDYLNYRDEDDFEEDD